MVLTRRVNLKLWMVCSLCTAMLLGCISPQQQDGDPTFDSNEPPLVLRMQSVPFIASVPRTPAQELAALERVAPAGSKEHKLVQDIALVMRARFLEAQGRNLEALKYWREAAQAAEKTTAQETFEGWLLSYFRSLEGRTVDREVFAKLVLAEAKAGKPIKYIANKRLNSQRRMVSYLDKVLPYGSFIATETEKSSPVKRPKTPLPFHRDKLLKKSVAMQCSDRPPRPDVWDKWKSNVPAELRKHYLPGLLAKCRDRREHAASYLDEAIQYLKDSKKFAAQAVYAAEELAILRRRMDQRLEAAAAYRLLMDTWANPNLRASGFGESQASFQLRRINDSLWAARYRALIGDYFLAEKYVTDALELVIKARRSSRRWLSSQRKELTNLHAEAYHVKAFRIEVERKDYEVAIASNVLALQIPYLPSNWRARFLWYLGFYQYLAGRFDKAQVEWQKLLKDRAGDSYRSKLLFWLARATQNQGNLEDRDSYLKQLRTEFPLSFYTVVAASYSFGGYRDHWQQTFPQEVVEKKTIRVIEPKNLSLWRRDPLLRKLIRRSEILLQAGLSGWARAETRALERTAKRKYAVERNLDRFVYVAALLFASEDYHRSIWLLTSMDRLVEGFWQRYSHILPVYYPRPYYHHYLQEAFRSGRGMSSLLAVARQESSFRKEVTSHAGAVGVMQILPMTAQKVAETQKMEMSMREAAERLKDPRFNIRIGAAFLNELARRYGESQVAIYGAYNAGAFSMDAWRSRRKLDDPMLWVEMIPYGETNNYIKNVWRNEVVYNFLDHARNKGYSASQTVELSVE